MEGKRIIKYMLVTYSSTHFFFRINKIFHTLFFQTLIDNSGLPIVLIYIVHVIQILTDTEKRSFELQYKIAQELPA